MNIIHSTSSLRFTSYGKIPVLGTFVGLARLVYAVALGIIGVGFVLHSGNKTHLNQAKLHLMRATLELSTLLIFPAFWIAKKEKSKLSQSNFSSSSRVSPIASSSIPQTFSTFPSTNINPSSSASSINNPPSSASALDKLPSYPGRGRFYNRNNNCTHNSAAIIYAHTLPIEDLEKTILTEEDRTWGTLKKTLEQEKKQLEESFSKFQQELEKLNEQYDELMNEYRSHEDDYPSNNPEKNKISQQISKTGDKIKKTQRAIRAGDYQSQLDQISNRIQENEKNIKKKLELEHNRIRCLGIIKKLQTTDQTFQEEEARFICKIMHQLGFEEKLVGYNPYRGHAEHERDSDRKKLYEALFNSNWTAIRVGGNVHWYTMVRKKGKKEVDIINDNSWIRTMSFNSIFEKWNQKGVWKTSQIHFYYPPGETVPSDGHDVLL